MDLDILSHLTAKLPFIATDLERAATRVDYVLFSRSGFTKALVKEARAKGILLLDVKDVLH